jgi:oxygen-independent coproporphyrinogen-3 oxidase
MTPGHLYVHVPFCAAKCPYCDFNSHAGRDDEQDAYVDALLAEARRRAERLSPRTIFVGGGTPSHLSSARLERLLGGLVSIVGAERLEEATVEANPGSLDREKLRVLVGAGFDRVSLGVQGFDDGLLKVLGRVHDARDAVRSAALIREAGALRLSIDLILAVPGQGLVDQERDLARAIDLEPEHVSAYVLTFEPGTRFTRWMEEGRLPAPEASRELAHLDLAVDRLGSAGYVRYEVSNFARAGAACRHNLAYWRDADWIGLGAGAHSHEGARRRANVSDPALYVRRMRDAGDATNWVETSPPPVAAFDALMMGLRLVEGVDLAHIAARTGHDLRAEHGPRIAAHVDRGLLVLEGTRLRATRKGFDVLSAILREMLPDVSGVKTETVVTPERNAP